MIEPYRVVSTAEMRALEQAAFDAGTSEPQLQKAAGRAVAEVVGQEAGSSAQAPIVACAGPGNNGRDAMVAARCLAREGYPVSLYLSPGHSVHEDELGELERLGVQWLEHAGSTLSQLSTWLAGASVVIDGLLGIGVRGPMRSPLADIAETLNATRPAARGRLRVVSVDVPSGLDSDSGHAPGTVVQADVTVALGAVKAGTLRFPGAALAGRLEPRPIGLPTGAMDQLAVHLLDFSQAAALVPPRPLQAHKGSLGSVLVVGGSAEYVGAPILAATGAARTGCGLVGLAVPRHVQAPAAARLPEATYALLPTDGPASDPLGSLEAIARTVDRFDVLVLGPGLGRSDGAGTLVRELLSGGWPTERPVVVDADALALLAQRPEWWEHVRPPLVLTPHLAEMSRLNQQPLEAIQNAAWEMAGAGAGAWGQVVVLKSALTVVAAPTGTAWVSPWVNPALASGGTGDVLAGLIGGLLAQGLERASAAVLAVALQAHAAATLVTERRWRTLLASDVAEQVPASLAALAEHV